MKNKKGVSAVIGYVLLVSIVVIMGVVVYQWLKTYVPTEEIKCPDDVSLIVEDFTYNCATEEFRLNLRNNGLFNVDGYFIHATDAPDKDLATTDISAYTPTGEAAGLVRFTDGNPLKPGSRVTHVFDLSALNVDQIYKIQIIPARQEEVNGRVRLASCAGARIEEDISCTSS